MVFSSGLMEGNMKECGKKENSMEREYIKVQTVKDVKVNGQRVKEFVGFRKMETLKMKKMKKKVRKILLNEG